MTGPYDLTIFALPKAFQGHVEIIQSNAVRSWTLLEPMPEIILFGSDEGTARCAASMGLRHEPEVAQSPSATPLVSDLFRRAERLSDSHILCYVNADIILPRIFMSVIEQVTRLKERFLISGERWDLDIKEPIDFSEPSWEAELVQEVRRIGKPLGKGGMDYFVYTRGMFDDIPPFAIGRTAWDNWLLYQTLKQGVSLIDASEMVLAVHQNHDYAHAGGYTMAWKGPEAETNLKLAGDRIFNLEHATHIVRPDGLHSTLTLSNAPYRLYDYIYLSGRLRFLRPILKGGKRLIDIVRGRKR